MAQTFDLQSHSLRSDGSLSPTDVVIAAAAVGVKMLSLTDHDTVDGVSEALAAASNIPGFTLVRGIEISALDETHGDLHICGYEIDHESPALLDALESWRGDRAQRGWRMVELLKKLGWQLDEESLRDRESNGQPIGRPHVAGAAFSHPANAQRIQDEGFANKSDLLVAYLVPGAPAYSDRTVPTVSQAVDVIHAAGGVAVWAHPFWDVKSTAEVQATVHRFASDHQIDGVETFYPSFSEQQTRDLHAACSELGLLTTGSSDFHGPEGKLFADLGAFETYDLEVNLGPIGATRNGG